MAEPAARCGVSDIAKSIRQPHCRYFLGQFLGSRPLPTSSLPLRCPTLARRSQSGTGGFASPSLSCATPFGLFDEFAVGSLKSMWPFPTAAFGHILAMERCLPSHLLRSTARRPNGNGRSGLPRSCGREWWSLFIIFIISDAQIRMIRALPVSRS